MPETVSDFTGDGVANPIVEIAIALPDAGSSIAFVGSLTPVGGSLTPLTGSPVTAPSPPGSGSIYWILQAATATGVVTMKQSTVSQPLPDAGNVVVFGQTLTVATTDEAINSSDSELVY